MIQKITKKLDKWYDGVFLCHVCDRFVADAENHLHGEARIE